MADAAIRTPERSACFAPEEDEQRSEQAPDLRAGARDTELARTKGRRGNPYSDANRAKRFAEEEEEQRSE